MSAALLLLQRFSNKEEPAPVIKKGYVYFLLAALPSITFQMLVGYDIWHLLF